MRRLARLLLIAMIALLPLRGFAAVLMAFEVAQPASTQHVALDGAAVSPCHESHDDGPSAPAASGLAHHGCSLCVLCHSAVVPLLDWPVLTNAGMPAAPIACTTAGSAQREPGPLDRPPRA